MSVFQIIALLLTLSALFSYLNYCFIKLPTTVGVMLIALIASLVLLPLQFLGFSIWPMAARVLQSVDFGQTLLQGMLSFPALRRRAAHRSQRPSGTEMGHHRTCRGRGTGLNVCVRHDHLSCDGLA